ncbi:MAG: leucine-rich repeat protein [Clostridia bacterium]
MKKSKVLLSISIIVVSAMLMLSIGFTAAIWESDSGVGTYTPTAPSTDWNYFAKYFDSVDTTVKAVDNTDIVGVAVTGFRGINLGEIVIPQTLRGKPVVEIRNTIFADTSVKQMPITIKIPPTVISIDQNAFSGLANLTRVVFGSSAVEATDKAVKNTCVVNDYAFQGCRKLTTLEIEGWRKIDFKTYIFAGTSLSAVIKPTATFTSVPTTFAGCSYKP